MDEIKKKYKDIESKYKLPKYKDLDAEFQISEISETHFITLKILEKINDKIDDYKALLESILQPDSTSLTSLYECKAFSDKEKRDVFELYKKIILITREIMKLSLNADENSHSKFIIQAFNDWNQIKSKMEIIIEKIKNSWIKEADSKEKLGYFG